MYPTCPGVYVYEAVKLWTFEVVIDVLRTVTKFADEAGFLLGLGEGTAGGRPARAHQAQLEDPHYLILMALVEVEGEREGSEEGLIRLGEGAGHSRQVV